MQESKANKEGETMPEKLAVINASLGSHEGKDGKKHAVYRTVGELFKHTDGRCFLKMSAYFDYGRLKVAEGHDAFFLEVKVPDKAILALLNKE